MFVHTLPGPARSASGWAARLADRRGLAWLRSDPRGALAREDARFSFLAADPVETSDALVPPPWPDSDPPAVGWGGHAPAPRWIGIVPYEAGRSIERTRGEDPRPAPLFARPRWLRYEATLRVDHATGAAVVEADHARAGARLIERLRRDPPALGGFALRHAASPEDPRVHVERVRRALSYIARGDIYQVNLARQLRFTFDGSPFALFLRFFAEGPAPYGFYADLGEGVVCAASPELALEVRANALRTAPIKGTRPRGADARADAALARELDADAKERAELTMAVDLHRNDLGRIASIGSVRALLPPRVVSGATVFSRVAEVRARRRPGASLDEIVRAVVPCGSVTGAPKIRAMEIISSLEPFRRGLYTGAMGYVGRDGALVLAMAIRCLEVAPHLGVASYATGGGIVADSHPQRELEETRWKAAQLEALSLRTPDG